MSEYDPESLNVLKNGLDVDKLADAFGEVIRHEMEIRYLEMELSWFRQLCAEHPTGVSEATAKFLEETKDLPGEALIAIADKQVKVLRSADGNLLRFA